jgi:hypothetical protein
VQVADLYRTAVFSVFLGGLLLGVIRFVRFFSWRSAPRDTQLRNPYLNDALLLTAIAAIPQALILTLPVVYPTGPQQVPVTLAEPAIMAGAAVFTVWAWISLCLHRARRASRVRLGWLWLLLLAMPAVVSAAAFITYGLSSIR